MSQNPMKSLESRFHTSVVEEALSRIEQLNWALSYEGHPVLTTNTLNFYKKPENSAMHMLRYATKPAYRAARPAMEWLEKREQLAHIPPLMRLLQAREWGAKQGPRAGSSASTSQTYQYDDGGDSGFFPTSGFSVHPQRVFNTEAARPVVDYPDNDGVSSRWNAGSAPACDDTPQSSGYESPSYDGGSSGSDCSFGD